MSTFDHTGLIQNINANLAPLRKAQPEAMPVPSPGHTGSLF